MNLTKFFLLSFLLVSTMCIMKKKKEKALVKDKSKQWYQLSEYSWAVSSVINEHKSQFPPYIWIKQTQYLDEIARQECLKIIEWNDFGSHSRLYEQAESIPNEYFTEISLDMQISELPESYEFAKNVLNTIIEQQPSYLENKEDYIGVHMEQWPGNPTQYTLVIAMVKRPKYYRSCKDQEFFYEQYEYITILRNGQLFNVRCEGNWTMISEINQDMHGDGTVNIDDFGLNYTEIMWVSEPLYFQNLFFPTGEELFGSFSGWNFETDMIKFNDMWYLSFQAPEHPNLSPVDVRGPGFPLIQSEVGYFDLNKDIEIIEQTPNCMVQNIYMDGFCAQKFIMKNLPGRIQAISDVESISKTQNQNNNYYMAFKIFVR